MQNSVFLHPTLWFPRRRVQVYTHKNNIKVSMGKRAFLVIISYLQLVIEWWNEGAQDCISPRSTIPTEGGNYGFKWWCNMYADVNYSMICFTRIQLDLVSHSLRYTRSPWIHSNSFPKHWTHQKKQTNSESTAKTHFFCNLASSYTSRIHFYYLLGPRLCWHVVFLCIADGHMAWTCCMSYRNRISYYSSHEAL